MDAYEFNKIAGWALAALLSVLGINFFSGAVFASKAPATQGYALPSGSADSGPKTAVTVPLPELLAKADAKKGEAEFRKNCLQCHIAAETGEKKQGPTLYGVVTRKVAAAGGFGYSGGIQDFAKTNPEWTYEQLDRFIANPKGAVKGTAMNFGGLGNAEARANLIAYLRTLAKEPAPLPPAK
jgi:cytochrome c